MLPRYQSVFDSKTVNHPPPPHSRQRSPQVPPKPQTFLEFLNLWNVTLSTLNNVKLPLTPTPSLNRGSLSTVASSSGSCRLFCMCLSRVDRVSRLSREVERGLCLRVWWLELFHKMRFGFACDFFYLLVLRAWGFGSKVQAA